MSHFSAPEWFDFVRDPAASEQSASMRRHLEDGCAECQELSDTWREVLEIARREGSYRPPEEAVKNAKVAFSSETNWKWLPRVAQLAQLLFDSMLQPLPAEVRGAAASSRQFLQEAKPFLIDLRVECEPVGNVVHLIGQVVNSREPNKDVAEVDVFLLKGENLATKTSANPLGEFDLDFRREEDLQLFVDIRGQKVIEIPLPPSLLDCHETAGKIK